MEAAQRALDIAQVRGLPGGIDINAGRVATLTARIEQFRDQWRLEAAREGELRNRVTAFGIDPHAVPRDLVQEIVAAERTPQASWRNDTITKRQIAKLEELATQTEQPITIDTATLTKGEAHDLISAILSGNLPDLQIQGRPRGPLPHTATDTTSDDTETAARATVLPGSEDAGQAIRSRILAVLAEPDPEADTYARPSVNTADQFLAWAEGHFTTKAQVALADLMTDRDNLTDEMFVACRAVLVDRSRWQELGRTAAEAYWLARTDRPVQDPTVTAIVDAVVAARDSDEREVGEAYLDTAQHAAQHALTAADPHESDDDADIRARIERHDAVQESLDLAAAPEIEDWDARAYAAVDPAAPHEVPAIDSDAGFAVALRKISGESARRAFAQQWWSGAARAQRDAARAGRTTSAPAVAAEKPHTPHVAHTATEPVEPEPEPEREPEPEAALPPIVAAHDFELGTEVLVPSGAKARVHANIAAARLATELARDQRSATVEEQAVLARWSGWGAVPEVFDNRPRFRAQWADERAELVQVLGDHGFAQARETTLNAHYTDPAIVAELWRAVARAGLPEGALILEPGCGAGHFVGTAPPGTRMVGVEIEPISAQIAHHLYPSQQIRNHGFERNFADPATFSGAIGNVPFGKHGVYDPIHNAAGHSLHNQFIVKALALTAPGGYVAVVTSAYTSDAKRADARKKITETGDLIGAVRLPTGAFDRQAKTAVVTDVLVFRRRTEGQLPTPATVAWAGEVKAVQLDRTDIAEPATTEPYWINDYFRQNPEHVLGNLAIGHGPNGSLNLIVAPRTRVPLAEQLRRQLDPIIDDAVNRGLGFSAAAPDPGVGQPFLTPGLLPDTVLDSVSVEPGTMRFDEVTGQFEQFQIGQGWAQVTCTGKDKAEQWKMLIALGDTVMTLTEASRSTESTRLERDELRDRLGTLYDSYTHRWGPLNRFTLTDPAPLTEQKITERLDKAVTRWRLKAGKAEARDEGLNPEDAEPYAGPIPDEILEDLADKAATQPLPQKNQNHLKGAILRDPRVGMVLAIEKFQSRFDGTDAVAQKSPIFTEDTTPFKARAESAEHFDEAMAISFDELGYLSPERMGELLDFAVGDVTDWSRGRMFASLDHPGEWEIAEKFLSGHVRDKLARARMLAAEDPELYEGAVEALENVVPADVDPATIGVRPGATWVPMAYYRQFLIAEFGLNERQLTTEFDSVSGNWNFETSQYSRHENATNGYTDKYGSNRLPGVELFNLIANNRAVQVLKTAEELERSPKPRFHQDLTAAARSSATALQERFAQWLWSDGDRYVTLAATYNQLCNSFVKPQFGTEFKQFPGLNPKYTPYAYQAAAVQRFLHDETILLDHVVGAGKTLTMTMACVEAKRLGQIRQPWVVVPNHLLAQWGTEARDAYPNAKILVASELDGVADRQRFIGQTAVGDWDMVIVAQSVFGLIGMKREAQLDYLDNELDALRQALDAANDAGSEFSVKQIENTIKATKKRIETIIDQKSTDDGLSFEQSGCDFLFIDITDRKETRTRRPACVTFMTSRDCLPTRSGTSVMFGQWTWRAHGTTGGHWRSARPEDRAQRRAALLDDRLARWHGAPGGGSVPTNPRRLRHTTDLRIFAGRPPTLAGTRVPDLRQRDAAGSRAIHGHRRRRGRDAVGRGLAGRQTALRACGTVDYGFLPEGSIPAPSRSRHKHRTG